MKVQEIWRYPVKSMAGESLGSAELTDFGITGDRIMVVKNAASRIITAKVQPLLLRHHATLSSEGEVLVDGRPWNAEDIAHIVESAAGAGAHLVESDRERRFDVLPLYITTDGMLTAVGQDSRRFRPNLVIGSVPGLGEREWEGSQLRIGPAIIGVENLRARCVVTTFDPDTGQQDLSVLRRIQKEFTRGFGFNCSVVVPGHISIGDTVELMPRL